MCPGICPHNRKQGEQELRRPARLLHALAMGIIGLRGDGGLHAA
jgi:hypothetical protein